MNNQTTLALKILLPYLSVPVESTQVLTQVSKDANQGALWDKPTEPQDLRTKETDWTIFPGPLN